MSDFFGIAGGEKHFWINKGAIKFVRATDCEIRIIFDHDLDIILRQDNNDQRDQVLEDLRKELAR